MNGRALLLLTATAAAMAMLQSCGSPAAGPSSGSPVTAPPGSGERRAVDMSLVIATTSQKAGATRIFGTLIVTNTTGRPVDAGCGFKFRVGLTNDTVPFRPAFTLECQMNATVEPGVTRYPIAISTTAESWPGGTPIPALPAGTYRTEIVFTGLAPTDVRLPGPITVTLS